MMFCTITMLLCWFSLASGNPKINVHPVRPDSVGDAQQQPLQAQPVPKMMPTAAYPAGINYNGGAVMTGTTTIHILYYGAGWTSSQMNFVNTFITEMTTMVDLKATPNAWFNLEKTYHANGVLTGTPSAGPVVLGTTLTDTGYTLGKSLTGANVWTLLYNQISSGRFPSDANAIYLLATDQYVLEGDGPGNNFCSDFCGWHTYANAGINYKFSFIGHGAACPGGSGCLSQGTGPNGDAFLDSMLSVIAHEVVEAMSDPEINAYYSMVSNSISENADKCAWTWGTMGTASNGARYNMVSSSGKKYLVQQNWNALTGACDTSASTTVNPSPAASSSPSSVVPITVGSSSAPTKTVVLPMELDCPGTCGASCRLNTDFPGALDTFSLVVQGVQLTVTRTDGTSWGMNLIVPCTYKVSRSRSPSAIRSPSTSLSRLPSMSRSLSPAGSRSPLPTATSPLGSPSPSAFDCHFGKTFNVSGPSFTYSFTLAVGSQVIQTFTSTGNFVALIGTLMPGSGDQFPITGGNACASVPARSGTLHLVSSGTTVASEPSICVYDITLVLPSCAASRSPSPIPSPAPSLSRLPSASLSLSPRPTATSPLGSPSPSVFDCHFGKTFNVSGASFTYSFALLVGGQVIQTATSTGNFVALIGTLMPGSGDQFPITGGNACASVPARSGTLHLVSSGTTVASEPSICVYDITLVLPNCAATRSPSTSASRLPSPMSAQVSTSRSPSPRSTSPVSPRVSGVASLSTGLAVAGRSVDRLLLQSLDESRDAGQLQGLSRRAALAAALVAAVLVALAAFFWGASQQTRSEADVPIPSGSSLV